MVSGVTTNNVRSCYLIIALTKTGCGYKCEKDFWEGNNSFLSHVFVTGTHKAMECNKICRLSRDLSLPLKRVEVNGTSQ